MFCGQGVPKGAKEVLFSNTSNNLVLQTQIIVQIHTSLSLNLFCKRKSRNTNVHASISQTRFLTDCK